MWIRVRGGHDSNMAHLIAVGAFTKYGVKAHSASGQASQPLQEEDRAPPWVGVTYKQGENKGVYTSSRQGW